ncbi:MAG TPA: rhodanese-like domain-containing protein [Saprospiraceae bacterium]|nr:rhodanese-like domain-containing protein [Saprospiraceae bacterium]
MHHFIRKIGQLIALVCIFTINGCSQNIPPNKPSTLNPAFDDKITSLLRFNVPLISVEELAKRQDSVLLLDAREKEEYKVSHIKGAKFVGYKNFREEALEDVPKDQEIVIYCSIGYRSEKMGERLEEMGYKNVRNLYGSIFEWVNQGKPVVDQNGNSTTTVHGYNKNWSQWLDGSKVKKTW